MSSSFGRVGAEEHPAPPTSASTLSSTSPHPTPLRSTVNHIPRSTLPRADLARPPRRVADLRAIAGGASVGRSGAGGGPAHRIARPSRDADAALLGQRSAGARMLPRTGIRWSAHRRPRRVGRRPAAQTREGPDVAAPGTGGADLETLARVDRADPRRTSSGSSRASPTSCPRALMVLLAEGHLLIEDVPGVGKTMLSKALARSIDCSVRRIQFTPDLLPSDVTGVSVFNQNTREFEFRPGRRVRQHRGRRRDQPGLPQDPVGAAGVHGGAAGHRRQQRPTSSRRRSW